jgi:hypothetical protein
VEIAWAPPVAEAAILVASAAYGAIACAPHLAAGEAAVSSVAYPHVAATASV